MRNENLLFDFFYKLHTYATNIDRPTGECEELLLKCCSRLEQFN